MAEASLELLRGWMRSRGWQPLAHQEEAWSARLAGSDGLVCVPTGMGKTYAAYFGALAQVLECFAAGGKAGRRGLRILWITPLRAMARDIEAALRAPVEELGFAVEVASRIGDTSAYRKRKLRERMPTVLLTTPESLSILLSYEDAAEKFADVQTVVVDEWHELASSKRGTQTELALARMRGFSPALRTWALSATLGNVEELARVAAGVAGTAPIAVVRSEHRADVRIRSVLGPDDAQLPWFGFLGGAMFDAVIDALDPSISTLLFTNTRNQAERWYRALLERRPEWFEQLALHHGSIDGEERARIESGLDSGRVTLVVCTSSLDLGVDFTPVQRVVQIGSARGIAQLLQRAGRSGHRPGVPSEVWMVPTHAMQLLEIEALRRAVEAGEIEARRPLIAPLDVLVQHLVTCAVGGGFVAEDLFAELRGTHAYKDLSQATFDRALAFVADGGEALDAYPRYQRIGRDGKRWVVREASLARDHRMAIGTITADSSMRVRYLNGGTLGNIEERFLTRVRVGDRFVFAGRVLELVAIRDMEVRVRAAKGSTDHVPKWVGGRLPLSDSLARATVQLFAELRGKLGRGLAAGQVDAGLFGPEVARAAPILKLQAERSQLPGARVLAECTETAEGSHLFLFPFGGQLAHQGLAALLAERLGRRAEVTFALSANDYGIELLASGGFAFAKHLAEPSLWDVERLDEDAMAAVNAAELGRRQFREIARVAGLVQEGVGRFRKGARQLQTSAGLLYDVFEKHEPDHLLLQQVRAEVLQRQFDRDRLAGILARCGKDGVEIVTCDRPSPLAFPLLLERVEARVSTESQQRRVERIKEQWRKAAAADLAGSAS
ncbi:MAG: ligase-associated DNA damage response DEXH box helicase [Planctomycetota bacterium]